MSLATPLVSEFAMGPARSAGTRLASATEKAGTPRAKSAAISIMWFILVDLALFVLRALGISDLLHSVQRLIRQVRQILDLIHV